MLDFNNKNDLAQLLYDQAKKCQTVEGAAILLAINAHIKGTQVFGSVDELWESVDILVNKRHEGSDETN